jgi:hypothetical protein
LGRNTLLKLCLLARIRSWNNSSSHFQVLPHLRGQDKGFSTFE